MSQSYKALSNLVRTSIPASFIHSFIHSFHKRVLVIWGRPSTILNAGNTAVNNTGKEHPPSWSYFPSEMNKISKMHGAENQRKN